MGAVEFDYKLFERIVKKDFKGIFYHEFRFPLPPEWKVKIISEFEKVEKLAKAGANIFKYLDKGIEWSKSGHKDIFKYKFKTMTPNEEGIIYDSDDLDEAHTIASVQYYHDKIWDSLSLQLDRIF